jgi:phosphatidylserine decarboxylase
MNDDTLFRALRLVPKNVVSRVVGAAARLPAPGPVRTAVMKAFSRRYGVNLDECEELGRYGNFTEFFTRALKPGARTIAPGNDVVISPVDAVVSECGLAEDGKLLQAKGRTYSVARLLGAGHPLRDAEGEALHLDDVDRLTAPYRGGAWATLYLAPRDYHRIHFPLSGKITGWRYLPGHLWPVNPWSVARVADLFCVNERLITFMDTPLGQMAIVAVGATIVGRIRAYYDDAIPVSNAAFAQAIHHDYKAPILVQKGDGLGVFEMGSTVILLFERGKVSLETDVAPGAAVRFGQPIAGPA